MVGAQTNSHLVLWIYKNHCFSDKEAALQKSIDQQKATQLRASVLL